MTSRVIKSEAERDSWITLLKGKKLPITVTAEDGRKRSVEQNKLQRMWLNEAAEQLGEYRAEEYRAYCKLHFGVPILRGEDEDFREKYDAMFKGRFDYEEKLKLMMVPWDFPVTRLMKMGQKKRYLDDVYQHFRGLGVELTEPRDEA